MTQPRANAQVWANIDYPDGKNVSAIAVGRGLDGPAAGRIGFMITTPAGVVFCPASRKDLARFAGGLGMMLASLDATDPDPDDASTWTTGEIYPNDEGPPR